MAVFQGNRVPYGAGGHWYVQVDVTDAGSNTGTSTTVWYTYQVVFENSVNDSTNTISWDDPWGHGEANNTHFNGAGTYTVGGTYANAAPIQYGGGNSLHFSMFATGMAGAGGSSEVAFDYPLPGRSGSPPSPPLVGADGITDSYARIYTTVAGADNGFPTEVINYRLHRTVDGLHLGDIHGGYGGVNWWGLQRATLYTAFGQGYNQAGWGAFSPPHTFQTRPSLPGAPGAGAVSGVGPTSVTIRWPNVDNGGATITSWAYQGSVNPSFTGTPIAALPFDSNGGLLIRNGDLSPGRTYYFRARAGNSEGVGGWSPVTSVSTLAGGWVVVNGVSKLAVPYVKDNGTWKLAVPYGKVNGIWRPVSG